MSSDLIYKTITTSPDASLALGQKIGSLLRGGETIELASDLGGGKTVIVKGIAKGLGYSGEVTSPTFTISRVYKLGRDLELHHFDFYRIGSGDIVADELAEVTGDSEIIVAVEWAGNAGNAMPQARVRIEIESTRETERVITVQSLGGEFDYVLEGLKKT